MIAQMCRLEDRGNTKHLKLTPGSNEGFFLPGIQPLELEGAQDFSTVDDDKEGFVMFTIAVILFIVGSIIAVINGYCIGTRCMRVGSNREYAHFSPCTFY